MQDVRFWDHTQAEWYRNVVKMKHKTIPMKWIGWACMERQNDPVFTKIRVECEARNLVKI